MYVCTLTCAGTRGRHRHDDPQGVKALDPNVTHTLTGFFSHPAVAAALGVTVGAVLLLLSRASFRTMRPEDAERGLALTAVALFGRLAVATASLFAYSRLAPEGLAAYGIALAGTFLALYSIELIRSAGLHRFARSEAGTGIGGR